MTSPVAGLVTGTSRMGASVAGPADIATASL